MSGGPGGAPCASEYPRDGPHGGPGQNLPPAHSTKKNPSQVQGVTAQTRTPRLRAEASSTGSPHTVSFMTSHLPRGGLGLSDRTERCQASKPPPLVFNSKTALLEGLEVDQYMLGILIYIQK